MDPRPVVVLLHGALGCGEDWGAVEAALAPTCRVFVPDLLGGEAGLPVADAFRYGVGDEAESMLMRIGARVPPHARVHLVGHDYGAVVALEMARRHPERIAVQVRMFGDGRRTGTSPWNAHRIYLNTSDLLLKEKL